MKKSFAALALVLTLALVAVGQKPGQTKSGQRGVSRLV